MRKSKILKIIKQPNDIVYAIETKDHTFIADGVIHHNCQICNRTMRGNLVKYRQHLVREIGNDAVREIETRPPRKIPTSELQEMLDDIKAKYKALVAERKKSLHD